MRPPASAKQEARTTTVEREAVLVGIDVGTSKVCTLIGEVSRDGRMTVMGHGTVPSSGLKKGEDYSYECTFPGHNALMKGKFTFG